MRKKRQDAEEQDYIDDEDVEDDEDDIEEEEKPRTSKKKDVDNTGVEFSRDEIINALQYHHLRTLELFEILKRL
jgi:hypothetical protein